MATPANPNNNPPSVTRWRKFRRHIGTSNKVIQMAVEEATIATKPLLI